MRLSTLTATLFALVFGAASSGAQSTPVLLPPALAPGWAPTAAVGLGLGTAQVTCAACLGQSRLGPAGFVRVGDALRPDLIIGLQLDWWQSTTRTAVQETSVILSSTNLVLQYYPSATNRWFVTTGLGVGFMDVSTTAFGGENGVAHGVGYQFGVGYAKPVGRHLALTPYATYFGTTAGTITDWQDRLSGSAFHFGVSLDWHQPVMASPGAEVRALPRGRMPLENLHHSN